MACGPSAPSAFINKALTANCPLYEGSPSACRPKITHSSMSPCSTAVRQRFAAGDAIAILSADLEQVIWANGPGAAVFGYPDIEAIIGASAQLPLIARRQIMATRGFPQIGSDRAITVRLATGMTSRAVGFLASAVTMPDGEKRDHAGGAGSADRLAQCRRDRRPSHQRLYRRRPFHRLCRRRGQCRGGVGWLCGARHPARRRWRRL